MRGLTVLNASLLRYLEVVGLLTLFHMGGAFFAPPPPTEQFNVAVRRQVQRG